MDAQLALYKGKGDIGNYLIRWWTSSIYSHCELVVDGWCYSSSLMDKGVRRKKIDLTDGKWDLIDLPGADRVKIKYYFYTTDSDKYGALGLICSQIFNMAKQTPGAQFCSEWCANALGLVNASSLSPASLGKLCKSLYK